jgi:hypothetical protein
MDGQRFDVITRAFGRRTGRRGALLAVAGVAGAAAASPVSAEVPFTCYRIRARCRRHAQCCSLTCVDGRCAGSSLGGRCIASDGCAVGYCHMASSYRGSCRCILRNRRCSLDKECCSGVCSTIGRCGCSQVGQACEMSMHCCGTAICVEGGCVAV